MTASGRGRGVGSNQYQSRAGNGTQRSAVAEVGGMIAAVSGMPDAERQFREAPGSTRTRIKRAVDTLTDAGVVARTVRYRKGEDTTTVDVLADDERDNPGGWAIFRMNRAGNQVSTRKSAVLFDRSGELVGDTCPVYWSGDVERICRAMERAGLAVKVPTVQHRVIAVVNSARVSALLDVGVPFEDAKTAASYGWKPEELAPWVSEGWSYAEVVSGKWAQYSIDPVAAGCWRAAGMDGEEAYQATVAGFTVDDVSRDGREAVKAAVAFTAEASEG